MPTKPSNHLRTERPEVVAGRGVQKVLEVDVPPAAPDAVRKRAWWSSTDLARRDVSTLRLMKTRSSPRNTPRWEDAGAS